MDADNIFDFIILYWTLAFLFFFCVFLIRSFYIFLIRSLVKKTRVELKITNILTYILKKESIAFLSMLVSLLTLFRISKIRDFDSYFHLWSASYLAPYLLFMAIPASLALALKKISGLLIALPYLTWLAVVFLWSAFVIVDPFREAGAALRAAFRCFYAFAPPYVLTATLWKKDEAMKNKVYPVALAIQLAVLAGAIYYYTYIYVGIPPM